MSRAILGLALLALTAAEPAVPAFAQAIGEPAPRATRRATPRPAPPPAAGTPPPAAAKPAAAAPAFPPVANATPAPPRNGCHNTGTYERWLADFRRDAAAGGISHKTIVAALDPLTLDNAILARDRQQGFFSQTFLDFQGRLVTPNRLQNGMAQLRRHAAIFARAETEFGVPGPVIGAFWGLESDYGSASGMGRYSILRSLASLAYDCRRSEMFRAELMAALKVIDRGDLSPAEMVGSWAGELGQTQFLPTHYFNYAVDYDGDGRRDLYHSVPDVIGSSANFLAGLGWHRGEPWLQEVRVGPNVPWAEADLAIQHPLSEWGKWGVTLPGGGPLPANGPPASLLLLMGRHGPAFLAYPNFQVYLKWNQSLVYATTAAYLANRMAGAPVLSKGDGPVPPPLSGAEMRELQGLLARHGYALGEPDGKLGASTRAAVKQVQTKLGLPADSWPTAEVLDGVRRMK